MTDWQVGHRSKTEYLQQNLEAAERGEVHAQRRLLEIFAGMTPESEGFEIVARYFVAVVQDIGREYRPFSPASREGKVAKQAFREMQRSALAKLGLARDAGGMGDPEIEGLLAMLAQTFVPLEFEKQKKLTRQRRSPRERAIAKIAGEMNLSERKVADYVRVPRAPKFKKGPSKSK